MAKKVGRHTIRAWSKEDVRSLWSFEGTDVRPADCEKLPRTAGAVSQKAFAFCASISLRSHCAHGGV